MNLNLNQKIKPIYALAAFLFCNPTVIFFIN